MAPYVLGGKAQSLNPGLKRQIRGHDDQGL